MYTLIKHISLILICTMIAAGMTLLSTGFPVHAQEASDQFVMEPDAQQLFDLINSARRDPLGTAESLGMNPDKILTDFPELQEVLTNGLPALEFNDRLYHSAGAHTADMLENGYYAYESLDGQTVDQRMNDAGYVAAASGESLGLLFFNNFIDPKQAVTQIFENMFKDELDPDWPGQRNILNPDVKELGVSVKGGGYSFDGFSGNVYLATCDFGAPVALYELELLQLINQARVNPKKVARYFDIDTAEVLNILPQLAPLFSGGVAPLKFNQELYAAARAHALDMLENGYYARNSLDGRTPAARFRESGYEPSWVGESRGRLSTCDVDLSPGETVGRMFKQMFFKGLQVQGRDKDMFSDKPREAGLFEIAGESSVLGGVCGDNLHMAVADYGASRTPTDGGALIGIVYNDLNGNGLYDAGEGESNVTVTVKSGATDALRKVVTDPAGGFSTGLEPGNYRVSVGSGDDAQVKWIGIDAANIWLGFAIRNAG